MIPSILLVVSFSAVGFLVGIVSGVIAVYEFLAVYSLYSMFKREELKRSMPQNQIA